MRTSEPPAARRTQPTGPEELAQPWQRGVGTGGTTAAVECAKELRLKCHAHECVCTCVISTSPTLLLKLLNLNI